MEKEKKKSKNKFTKILKIIGNIGIYSFFAIALITVAITIINKKEGNDAIEVLGYETRLVISPSMEKSQYTDTSEFEIKDIPVNSLVFIKKVPEAEQEAQAFYGSLVVGDVLTFKYVYAKQETITHRIVEIKDKDNGGYLIYLEGDNKNSDASTLKQTIDTSLLNSPNYIIGKVVGKSIALGNVLTILKSKVGIVLTIIVPCLLVIIWEILKIKTHFSKEKELKLQLINDEKEKEFELLKKKIEELERKTK